MHSLCTYTQEHFNFLVEKHGVQVTGLLPEWNQLKHFYKVMEHLDRHSFWSLVISEYKTTFPNLLQLISILLLFPVSNAILERFFSVMKSVTRDWKYENLI